MSSYIFKKPVYIVGAARTGFGKFCGTLSKLPVAKLGVSAGNGALAQTSLKPTDLDTSVWGSVNFADPACIGVARHVALDMGCRLDIPGLGVNRLCGSGFQAVASVADEIEMGKAKTGVAGGVENMSMTPFMIYGARDGFKLSQNMTGFDMLWQGLEDQRINLKMGMTAELLGEKYNVTREESDQFAFRSQQTWKAAHDAGRFEKEIVPMEVKVGRKTVTFAIDEGARPEATLEQLGRLPTVFKKGGVVTAGNASTINDGAAACILASEEAVKEHGLTPLSRIVGYSYVGVDPSIMGIGPYPAIENLWEASGVSKNDISMYEINEAFATQAVACAKALDLDMDKLNMNGGACALGHPVGTSGARITGHMTHELQRTGERYAMGSACIGGGQGIAMLLEKC